ncbi:MAG: hypothetical protein ACTHNP_06830 [Solirubrobacterales bacterium]
MADGDPTPSSGADSREGLSKEAKEVLGAVLILERDNVHLEKPRIRKELTELIKNHVR